MTKRFIRRQTSIGHAAALLLVSTPLFAQEAIELDTLVVTAGLQPLSARDVASSITVITRGEIELKQYRYLSDLLRDVPGFAVSQAGGVGTQTQVRVRGAEANQLLVLIDGVRANDPATGDEFPYQFALTSNIERIEIIRGPQSATWGSDAMAGVINIIHKKDVTGQFLSGSIESGSFDTLDANLGGGYAGETFRLNAWLSYFDTDGTNISRSGDEKDGAENTTGNITLEFDAGDAVRFRFSGQSVNATGDYDDVDYFSTGLPMDADLVTESGQEYLAAELHYEPRQAPWSGSFSVNWMNSDNDNFNGGLWTGSTAAETTEYRMRGGVVFGRDQDNRISFGIEHQDVDFAQRGVASMFGDPNQDQSYSSGGYALEYVGRPINGFTWTMSGRIDDYSDFNDAKTWQLAASYQLSPLVRLRGSLGTGSKTPTFTERYGYYEDFFTGNPNLKPESSEGWEIGVDLSDANGNYQFQFAWFDQDLQDEIDGFVYDPATYLFTANNRNTDSKRNGIEAILDAHMDDAFTLSASYTYTDATEADTTGQSVQEVRRPKHMVSVSASYYFPNDRGNLNLDLNYTGTQQDLFFSPQTYTSEQVDIDAYVVLNLAVAWRLTQSLELTGRVTNLLDEEYEEILGFVRPGRAVYAGLRGRFDF